MRFFIGFLVCALLGDAFGAPKFIGPDDSYPLIRRDRIPIDIDGINNLADQLALTADGPFSRSGKDLHTRARALALSQRLSPAQPRARAIIQSLSNNESRPNTNRREVGEAQGAIQRTAEWLVKLPPGEEGYLLGQLLIDIISARQKDHPLVSSHDVDNQEARWRGLIAPLEKFENKVEDAKPRGPELQFKTDAVLTTAPFFTYPIGKNGIMQEVSLVITDERNDGDGNRRILFRPRPNYDARSTLSSVERYFQSAEKILPRDKSFTIDTGKFQYAADNGSNLAAPVAILVDAALTGRPLRRNTYLFAKLEDDGSLSRPHNAWPIFLELAETAPPRGSRLIVPPGAADDLRSLLVLEKAAFFVYYEVIGASHFDETRSLFYEDGQIDPKLSAAMESYQEIWGKALESTSLQTFVSHKSVKERLATVVGHSNLHVSASFLTLQGNNRPPHFSEKMLARELNRCLEPLSTFRFQYGKTKDTNLRKLHDLIRKRFDPLERRIGNKEKPLYNEALELIKKLKGLARDMNKSSLNKKRPDIVAFRIFQGEVTAFRNRLMITSGDLKPRKPKQDKP